MADIKVYLFDYFDRLLKRDRRSTLYATADAIAAQGATIIAESEKIGKGDRVEVVEVLNDDGTIAAHKIPPREESPPARPRWNDPNDVGVGPG